MKAINPSEDQGCLSGVNVDLFRAIFEQAAVGVALIETVTGRFLRVNQRCGEILGYAREEMERLDFQTLTPAEDLPADLENLRRLVTGDIRELRMEKRYRHKDGRLVWVHLTVSPLWAPGELPGAHVAVVEDITIRKQMAAEVQRRNQQLQRLSMAAQQINSRLEVSAIVRQLVAAALELTGAEGGAAGLMLEGRMVFTEYHLQDRLLPIDYRFEPGSGVPGWVMQTRAPYLSDDAEHDPQVTPEIQQALGFRTLANVPILSPKGELMGCFEIHNKAGGRAFQPQDVELLQGLAASAAVALENARLLSEHQRTEVVLREGEARFRNLLQEVRSVAVQGYGPDGTTQYWNQASERLYGYTAQEAIGRNLVSLIIPPEMRGEVERAIRQMATTGRPTPASELLLMRKDGSRVAVFSSHAVVHVPGRPRELFCIDIDLTERKRAEAERERLQAELLQAQKMESVGRLAGGVAHDFNNMLQTILGNAALTLQDLPPDSPHRESLEEIQRSAERSADLTQQLLAFARKQTIAPRVLDLNDVVGGMLKMLRRLIGEHLDLAWVPGAGLWPVRMDPSQLGQILANLCVNARDAIADTGKVIIETQNITLDDAGVDSHPDCVPGDYVRLALSDTGHGMDAETRSHLFEPFFTTKALGKGTGLGLATVFGIVKQNQGAISVDSEPGQGTTFRVYLPRAAAAAAEAAVPPPKPRSVGGTETVMVVEDELQILTLGRRILQQLGYTVLTAATPAAALALAAQQPGPIHLLVTDVVMPGLNGKELGERLQQSHPDLKCLFMSGYTANVIAHHGVLEEGVHFLQKPFTVLTLAEKVREVLGPLGPAA